MGFASSKARTSGFNIMRDLGFVIFSQSYTKRNDQEFLNRIKTDIEFWKRLLNQNNKMHNKSAITHSLWVNYRYLSEFIKNRKITEEQKLLIENLLIELTKHETDFQRIYEMELITKIKQTNNDFLYGNRHFYNSIEAKLVRSLWQKNATLNDYYDNSNLLLICFSKLPVAEFYKFVKGSKPHCGLPKYVEIKYDAIDFYKSFHVYNFFGKYLARLNAILEPQFMARHYDLIGIINLVKLQLELKSVSKKDIAEAIKKSSIKNHYTGEAMNYDHEKNEIYFKCLYVNKYPKVYKLECNIKL
jgi:hypothetical protein